MIISDSKNGYKETKLEISHKVNLSFSGILMIKFL